MDYNVSENKRCHDLALIAFRKSFQIADREAKSQTEFEKDKEFLVMIGVCEKQTREERGADFTDENLRWLRNQIEAEIKSLEGKA